MNTAKLLKTKPFGLIYTRNNLDEGIKQRTITTLNHMVSQFIDLSMRKRPINPCNLPHITDTHVPRQ
ncbi:hypothetical protein IQ211_05300 [Xenorhabdus griffiniae]|nr:hypothetical protein [Xenorhabdus griffiniae]MBE8586783.1 hypothetical protein [Xenorhabdus griffiniae]